MLLSLLSSLITVSPVIALPAGNQTCAINPKFYSCENTTRIVDTCCSPTEGLVLSTQFWNTYTGLEANGSVLPKESWGIHGFWPDRCDGSYGQYCDLSRQYDPNPSPNTTTGLPNGTVVPIWKGGDIVSPLLKKYGKTDLLTFMNKYWKSRNEPDWVLWQHEFSKHATCFSTFDVGQKSKPDCYGSIFTNSTEASIIDYLETVVMADLKYPTYKWLSEAGIVPSNQTAVNLTSIQTVLTMKSGSVPYIGCSGPTRNVLSEVWYYAHTLGRPQEGIFKPLNSTSYGSGSNCNRTTPIWYYTRSQGSEK